MVLSAEGDAILPARTRASNASPACVSSALINAPLEEEQQCLIYARDWPPPTHSGVSELDTIMRGRERGGKYVAPSATAMIILVPFRYEEVDPLIIVDRGGLEYLCRRRGESRVPAAEQLTNL
jgi:hypothetical protein